MSKISMCSVVLLYQLLLMGCGDSSLNGGRNLDLAAADAASTTDASTRTSIGAACTDDPQCPQMLCVTEAPFAGGYCAEINLDCAHSNCPAGSACVEAKLTSSSGDTISEALCMKSCNSASECRTGYGCCSPYMSAPKICYPLSMLVNCH